MSRFPTSETPLAVRTHLPGSCCSLISGTDRRGSARKFSQGSVPALQTLSRNASYLIREPAIILGLPVLEGDSPPPAKLQLVLQDERAALPCLTVLLCQFVVPGGIIHSPEALRHTAVNFFFLNDTQLLCSRHSAADLPIAQTLIVLHAA